ncbi:hypothetical protein IF1G_06564 [Cordyceps javanica]|uniref:Uncharacterized protein n=1 Tax=Cordyceps javanica TaxID=43265 RepID=A0A545UYN5_9HYPO|nr:hypothetical protein IF1G_06564 [Cordyceps javanica]
MWYHPDVRDDDDPVSSAVKSIRVPCVAVLNSIYRQVGVGSMCGGSVFDEAP